MTEEQFEKARGIIISINDIRGKISQVKNYELAMPAVDANFQFVKFSAEFKNFLTELKDREIDFLQNDLAKLEKELSEL